MEDTNAAVRLTQFAPAERASIDSLREARKMVSLDKMLMTVLNALPDFAFVLNQQRQLVAANDMVLKAFNFKDIEDFIGKRPGEAVGCLFSTEGPDGCGSGYHCLTCGALYTVLESERTCKRSVHEVRLTINAENPIFLDLKAIATPIKVDGIPLTMVILKDISSEKRRLVLEKVFFHDVINTAGGIYGIASLLNENSGINKDREEEYKRWMMTLTESLIDEINHHRKLLAAERGDFKPALGLVIVPDLLRDVRALYINHAVASGRTLALQEIPDCKIISDSAILRRILGNMVKNALEAAPNGGTVNISCAETPDTVSFSVNNPGVMPEEVQLQLFQRSFSTKQESGRGIGTYSIKLFGERYLKGQVVFSSREPEGTTFTFTISKCSID